MSDDPSVLTEGCKEAFKAAQRPVRPCLSDRQIVREMLPEIRRKLEAGWSYEEVRAEMARTLGFKSALTTLYSYVSKLSSPERKQRRRASGASPVDPTPPNSEPVTPPSGRGRVSETLCGPEFRATLKQRAEKKPKPTLVDILNKPV